MSSSYSLKEIKLEVTYRCPLACVHCSSDATPSSPLIMQSKDCFRILDEAIALGATQLAFSGGEPLMWDSLGEAVHLASNGKLKVSVYTSGNVPSVAKKIESLRKSGLEVCIFSIFGATESTHERTTRVKGSYEKTREAIKAAVGCGLRVELHFVPMSVNFAELAEVATQAQAWGISQTSVLRLVPQGRASLIKNLLLNRLQNLQLKRMIQQLRSQGFSIRTGSPYNFLLINDRPKCTSGIDRLIIGPDLRIYPCDAFKQVKAEELVGTLHLSTLANSSLLECWHDSPFLSAVRDRIAAPFSEPCASCNAQEQCLSGCLAQKVIEYGDLEKRPDPMCLMVDDRKEIVR